MAPNIQHDDAGFTRELRESHHTLWLSHLINISNQLQDFSHPKNNLENILWVLKNLIPFEHAAIALFNHETGSPEMIFYREDIFNTDFPISEQSLHLEVFETKSPMTSAIDGLFDFSPERSETLKDAYIIYPLIHADKCYGTLGIERSGAEPFNHDEIQIIQIVSNQIGAALASHALSVQNGYSQKRYAQFFNRTNIPLFVCDSQGDIMTMNTSFKELIGWNETNGELQINFFDCLALSAARRETFKKLFGRCGFFQNLETQMKRLDNQILTVLFTITPIRNYENTICGYEGMIQDITEKRELEDQLIQAQKIGVLGSLAGGIAHDFNNLIGGIMGCASLVKSNMEQTSPHYDDIQTILSASQKAAELTQQLLTFSRKEKNNIKPLDLNDLIAEILNLLSRTIPKSIRIFSNLHRNLPLIQADATRVQQALMNICINARDAMPDGGTLSISTDQVILKSMLRTKPSIKPGHYVVIHIQDTGAGMNEKTLQHIFEPYFTTKQAQHGGLGMAIVFDVLGSHGGGVAVESQVNIGTIFKIYFPVSCDQAMKPCIHETLAGFPRGQETLLIVDDEELIRNMGKRMLEKFGYRVFIASSGREAINILKEESNKIDLMILDMIMPDMDGRETFKHLKEINPDIKVLVTTGYHGNSQDGQFSMDDFNGYLEKPFMTGQLLKTVRMILDNQPQN